MNSSSHKHSNRLAKETSPYLLQHAHDPVDWHPWGPEAFAIARRENKPIFLSVGYSTCYWCHVMERECFENETIAAEMNRRMVNIKVDREERPDVDQLYMTAVQLLTGQGGWPMSVFLLPDLRPFYGGTYFPPRSGLGRPGFPGLVAGLDDAFRNRRGEVEASAQQLLEMLRQLSRPRPPQEPIHIGPDWLRQFMQRSTDDFDSVHGGFGTAPKFPRQTLLELILTFLRQESDPILLKSLCVSLDAMAHGGIRDHLGGGFHRYSTDAQWLVPHFEIMLYDNAMLLWIYTEAYRQTRQRRYAAVARGIADFVLREMTSPAGAFFTALDAEVDGQEGGCYLWKSQEVRDALAQQAGPEEIARFLRVYGLDNGPNFADPHHGNGMPDKNVLYLAEPGQGEASALLDERLGKLREILYARRRQRQQPMLDRKILTSWNALMIRGLAHAAAVLREDRYLHAAQAAAEYVLRHHRDEAGALLRIANIGAPALSSSPGTPGEGRGEGEFEQKSPGHRQDAPHPNPLPEYRERGQEQPAFLDDYAFLIQALLALAETDDEGKWRATAGELAARMRQRFWASDGGAFFYTAEGAADLIVRQMVAGDSPLPSGNAVAAMVMLALGEEKLAAQTIATFAGQLNDSGEGMSALGQAALRYLRQVADLHVAPGDLAPEDRPLAPLELASRIVTMQAQWADPCRLELTCTVLNGFHVNAHEAPAPWSPTRLTVGAVPPDMVDSIIYPPGKTCRLALADEALSLYQGQWVIVVKFKTPPPAGTKLDLALSYQACDENACLPVVTRHFSATAP